MYFEEHDERQRSCSRSPLLPVGEDTLGGVTLGDKELSRVVPGMRGRMIFADARGYTYVQNQESRNRRYSYINILLFLM